MTRAGLGRPWGALLGLSLLAVALVAVLLVAPWPGGGPSAQDLARERAQQRAAERAQERAREKSSAAAEEDRPNIVVVMADDMRFDDLQFTPYIRKIARRGVTFENSFSNFPLCCPARASWLTGQLPHNHRVWHHTEPFGYGAFDDSRTLGTSLYEQGYKTGFIGKYLNQYGKAKSLVSGKRSADYVPHGWNDWMVGIDNPGNVGVKGGLHHYFHTAMNVNGTLRSHKGTYQTPVFGDYARRLVRKYHRRDIPFFIQVNYLAPHKGAPREPDDPPRRVRNRNGRGEKIQTPARPDWVKGRFDRRIDRAMGRARSGGPAERNVSDKPSYISRRPEPNRRVWRAVRELTRQRAESLLVMDRDVRRTVRKLKRTNEWRDTVLMITSDNGYYLGEHRVPKGKVHTHEPSFRVPFIVTGPGMRDGSKRYDPISTVDATATILDLAGASAPRPADGRSLVPALRRGDRGWTAPVMMEGATSRAPGRTIFGSGDHRRFAGVRTARYSFIRYNNGFTELYDLARDPHEMRSVARRDRYRSVRRDLQGVLDEIEDCTAAACQPALPPSLSAGVREGRELGRAWQQAHRRRYGFR